MSCRILIIEDEQKISRILQLELSHEGYEIRLAETGREGLELAQGAQWDLIILDVMLPELSGLEVLRRLRSSGNATPVIVLTARDATPDIVSGLDLGANDYITKPFEIEELLARIRVCVRTKSSVVEHSAPDETLKIADLVLNLITREVTRNDKKIELTPTEYDLLVFLMGNRNQVMRREIILQEVWGYNFMGDTNLVDVYIRYLRKKMDYDYDLQLIQTVRGVGYCIRDSL